MTPLDGLILGLVQGLTEFLPVSSTGHLILARDLLGLDLTGSGLFFDAALNLGTLAAVALYFWRDIAGLIRIAWRYLVRKPLTDAERALCGAVIAGTIPGVALGLMLQGVIETQARSSFVVAIGLVIGSFIMWRAERYAREHADRDNAITVRRGWNIGWFQAMALFPGISRSGATIAGALGNGMSREYATRFAFVLSFPILLGVSLVSVKSLLDGAGGAFEWAPLATGLAAALVSGVAAIHFLVQYLRRHPLTAFIWYRLALAAVILLLVL